MTLIDYNGRWAQEVYGGYHEPRQTQGEHMFQIIGFAGLKRSGKDAAAEVLLRRDFRKLAFAQPLKDMLRSLLETRGATPEHIERMLEGDLKEESSVYLMQQTPRYVMQALGTEWGRKLIDDELWIDTWKRAVSIERSRAANRANGIVVTDVRFQNEADMILAVGGKVYRVNRFGNTSLDNHASENGVLSLTGVIDLDNFGTLEEWQSKIARLFL